MDEQNTWLEARVIEINEQKVKVHYKGFVAKFDEWIELPSPRVEPISAFSKAYGPNKKEKESEEE